MKHYQVVFLALFISIAALAAVLLVLDGCESASRAQTEPSRISRVYRSDDLDANVRVYRDNKTGCEFLDLKQGSGEGLAYIPGTCLQ